MIPAETLTEWRRLAEKVNAPPREPAGYNCLEKMAARHEIQKRLVREAVPQLIDLVERLTIHLETAMGYVGPVTWHVLATAADRALERYRDDERIRKQELAS